MAPDSVLHNLQNFTRCYNFFFILYCIQVIWGTYEKRSIYTREEVVVAVVLLLSLPLCITRACTKTNFRNLADGPAVTELICYNHWPIRKLFNLSLKIRLCMFKSNTLQYNTLVRWDDGANNLLTKRLTPSPRVTRIRVTRFPLAR